MAKMRPEIEEEELREFRSSAEAVVYRALRDQLPDDVLVIHSLNWVYRSRQNRLVEGEADFTVFFRDGGFVAIEVKGGGVAFNAVTGKWSSIDRRQIAHPIKDPFRQAKNERFAVLDQIRGHDEWKRWTGRRILCGHAVFFPDLDAKRALVGPDRPEEIIGTRSDLGGISKWIRRVQDYWEPAEGADALGAAGMSLVESILCRSISVRPPLAVALRREEEQRIVLTEQQARALRILGGRKRAVIAGGAGTGKTLLAAEKARGLSAGGGQVLFLCYNRPLAERLRASLSDARNVLMMDFHQLCMRRVQDVKIATGRDLLAEAAEAYPGKDKFDVHMPFALALSADILTAKFDGIVVDEAQDFSEEYWFAIEALLQDQVNGALYLFTDPNQAIYRKNVRLPVTDEPFYLTSNCRNTTRIHRAAYRYYQGEPTDPPAIDGAEIITINAKSVEEQAAEISRAASRLLTNEGVSADQIVVLVLGRPKEQYYSALQKCNLGSGARWSIEGYDSKSVLLDTVRRFKGLEAAVVFLWLPPALDESDEREALYVGLSRAKSILYLVGSESETARFC